MTITAHRIARAVSAGVLGASLALGTFTAAFAQASLPEGTQIAAVLSTEDISTKNAQVGDGFTMDVVTPYPNGDPAFEGAKLRGHVAEVSQAGQGKKASLKLAFDSLVFPNGESAPVSAAVTSENTKADNTTARKGLAAAIGAAIGSQTIGRIIGGSAGSVVGLLGGATGGFLYANNNQANFSLPKGTSVNVQTQSEVEVPRRQAAQ